MLAWQFGSEPNLRRFDSFHTSVKEVYMYTPEEVAYLNGLFTSYKAILTDTNAIIASTTNTQVMGLANDTLADVAEDLQELFYAFMYGGCDPQGVVNTDDVNEAMAMGVKITSDPTIVIKKAWAGSLRPIDYHNTTRN